MIPQIQIPDHAPFDPVQRAWLNGFFAGLAGVSPPSSGGGGNIAVVEPPFANGEASSDEHLPWHDPTLSLPDRLKLADGGPLTHSLSAAMGQLDCGQCGYLCQTYAIALADGSEKDVGLCVPGGKATREAVKKLLAERPAESKANGRSGVSAGSNGSAKSKPASGRVYDRSSPLDAHLRECRRLTCESSEKDVRFVSIDVSGSGLAYESGDSLGVFPVNCAEHVDAILKLAGASGAELVASGRTLRSALREELDIRRTSDEFWSLCRRRRPDRTEEIDAWADSEESVDVLEALHRLGGVRASADEIAASLAKLQPRLYSISSSPLRHPEEVHLTIGVVRYDLQSGPRKGTASTFLTERLKPGDPVRVFVQRSPHFRVPADDVPALMIGPGTGVAPFRAFLQERTARRASGGNWLFYGGQRRAKDFLYQSEFAEMEAREMLRLDAAFSRDQSEKVYVQHLLRRRGREVWRWLERGAHVYVCGDASRMAKDVDEALRHIIAEHGQVGDEAAGRMAAEWSRSGRYVRDVY